MPEPQPEPGRHQQDRQSTWAVLIEVTASPEQPHHPFAAVQELVIRLSNWHATALYCADRYAIQLDVKASSSDKALQYAMDIHSLAAASLSMSPSIFLRAEVLDPEWMAAEWQGDEEPLSRPVPTSLYEATRCLLRATTPEEIREALAGFVAELGGSLHPGPRRSLPGMVTADVSLEPGDQRYAAADAVSVGGLMVELSLPALVEDARVAYQRLQG